MKYLKTYEDNNNEPHENDYAVVNINNKKFKDLDVIVKIDSIFDDFLPVYYFCEYTLPDGKTSHEIFYKPDFKAWSKNKEDLKYILSQNKYNL